MYYNYTKVWTILKIRKSINRFAQLNFVAASLTKLIFTTPDAPQKGISVQAILTISVFTGIVL